MEEIIGSKKNPYSYSNYNQLAANNDWDGGWTIYSDGLLYYISRIHDRYLATTYGRRNNPFTEALYDEIKGNNVWPGGYRYYGQNLVYTTKAGIRLSENGEPFGHIDDPCPFEAYEEMCDNGFWYGGWVQYTDSYTQYIHNFTATSNSSGSGSSSGSSGSSSGSGCGSGCGCGCGCGCGSGSSSQNGGSIDPEDCRTVSSDSKQFATIEHGEIVIFVCWTEGKPLAEPYSIPYSRIMANSLKYSTIEDSLELEWEDEYTISIRGSIYYDKNNSQNEPESYVVTVGIHQMHVP